MGMFADTSKPKPVSYFEDYQKDANRSHLYPGNNALLDMVLFGADPMNPYNKAAWDPSRSLSGVGSRSFDIPMPGMNSMQGRSLAALEQLAMGGPGQGMSAAQVNTSDAGRRALDEMLTRGPTDSEEFFNKTIRDPAMRDLFELVLPQAKRGTTGIGSQWGGVSSDSQEDILSKFMEDMVGQRAAVGRENRMADDATKLAALTQALPGLEGTSSSLRNQRISELLTMYQGGENARQIEVQRRQAELDELIRQFEQRMQMYELAAGVALQPTRGFGASSQGMSPLGSLLHGFTGGLGKGIGGGVASSVMG